MKRIWLLTFFLLAMIGSCIDPIQLDVATEEGLIVVEGGLTDQPGPYVVNLFRSVKLYNDLEKRPAVTGAFVYIIDEDGNQERLKDDVPGVFVSSNTFKTEYGKSYYLRIEAFDGRIYESAPQTLVPIDNIDSIYFEFQDKVNTGNPGEENNAGFNVYINATVNSGAEYVRLKSTGVYEVFTFPEKRMVNAGEAGRVPDPRPCSGYRVIQGILTQVGPCACCNCWVTAYDRSPEIADMDFYGGSLAGFNVGYVPATKGLFYSKYRVEVQIESISKELYDYWRLVKIQKEGGSSLFQPATAKIRGNLRCINDESAEIFGLFSVSAVKSKSIFIDKEDIPYKLLPIDTLADDCRFLFDNSTTTKPEDW
ncbi:MAG: DUF4249 domain-containing protein [Cyclobacteriaceae bacterium]